MEVGCPQCKKKTDYEGNPYRPFCSEFCKKRDLGKWADEQYKIGTDDGPSTDGDQGENQD